MVKDVLYQYWADRPMDLAAALSYYTLLSLAPLVLMTVALAGLVFERDTVEHRIVAEMRDLVGDDGAAVVRTVLRHANSAEKNALSVGLGAAVLLVGATSVFAQLQSSLNHIWKVEGRRHESAVWSFLRMRLVSLAMVLAVGFLLLVSLLVTAALAALGDTARGAIGEHPVLHLGNALVSIAVITVLFALIFKVLPDAPVAWRDVWIGAATTSVLFTIGKSVIGLYLGRASIGSAYGAAGSVVVLVVWVYYAAMILFFGAELVAVRSRARAR